MCPARASFPQFPRHPKGLRSRFMARIWNWLKTFPYIVCSKRTARSAVLNCGVIRENLNSDISSASERAFPGILGNFLSEFILAQTRYLELTRDNLLTCTHPWMTSSPHLNTSQQTQEGVSQSATLPWGVNDVLGFRYIEYRNKVCKKLESWHQELCLFHSTHARTHARMHARTHTQIRRHTHIDGILVPVRFNPGTYCTSVKLFLIDENFIGIQRDALSEAVVSLRTVVTFVTGLISRTEVSNS